MKAHQVLRQLPRQLTADRRFARVAEAGGHAIHRANLAEVPLEHRAPLGRALQGGSCWPRHAQAAVRDAFQLLDGERLANQVRRRGGGHLRAATKAALAGDYARAA